MGSTLIDDSAHTPVLIYTPVVGPQWNVTNSFMEHSFLCVQVLREAYQVLKDLAQRQGYDAYEKLESLHLFFVLNPLGNEFQFLTNSMIC